MSTPDQNVAPDSPAASGAVRPARVQGEPEIPLYRFLGPRYWGVWFGIGIVSKVALIVSLVYFVVLIYVLDGVRHINPDLLRFASTAGATRTQVLFKITLPSLLAWISASMKLGMSLAIIGAVVGEVVASDAGLGHYILQASYQVDTEGVYVGLTALAVMGWALVYSMERLDRRLFHWQREVVV